VIRTPPLKAAFFSSLELLDRGPDSPVTRHYLGNAVSSSTRCSLRDILYTPFICFLINNKQIVSGSAFLNPIYLIENETPPRLSFWYANHLLSLERLRWHCLLLMYLSSCLNCDRPFEQPARGEAANKAESQTNSTQ